MAPPRRASADEILAGRWTLPILRVLLDGPVRFSRLKQSIAGLSAKMLVDRLRALEEAGIVERGWLPEPADRQVYRMTDVGLAARQSIQAIDEWDVTIQLHASLSDSAEK